MLFQGENVLMGWAGGSLLMAEIIEVLKTEVPDPKIRLRIYKGVIPAFDDADCDTLDECEEADPAFKKAMKHNWRKTYDPRIPPRPRRRLRSHR